MESEESMTPRRVLHVLGGTALGGAESRIMDLFRQIDRAELLFDFLVHSDEKPRKAQYFDEEILRLGGRIYVLPKMKLYNYGMYRHAVSDFFKEHHDFAAVHGHMTSTAGIYLTIAKKYGIPKTIAHARSAGVDKGIKGYATRLMRCGLADKADDCFACSEEAAISVFGQKAYDAGRVRIFPNAIDTERFAFDEAARRRVRGELGLNGRFVVGHVGRFHYAKNHEFLLAAFALFREIYEKECGEKAALLLLGEGALMEPAKEMCRKLEIERDVIFAGNRSNVQDYYSAMDLFCFPSRFEGLPGTVVEAQASGLPCIISDRITSEVKLTGLVKSESIGEKSYEGAFYDKDREPPESIKRWAKLMLDMAMNREERRTYTEEIAKAGFDVRQQAKRLQSYYIDGGGSD